MGGLWYVAAIYLVCHHSSAVNDNDSRWRLGSRSLIVQDVKDSNGLRDKNYLHLKRKKKPEEDCQSAPVPWCCCLGAGAAKQRLIGAPVKWGPRSIVRRW